MLIDPSPIRKVNDETLTIRGDESRTTVAIIESELGFTSVGSWTLQACGTKLDCSRPGKGANRQPSVYLLASVAGDHAIVLYVGKASDGWRCRRGRHLGNRNRPFHEVIIRELTAGHAVGVYERKAGWAWVGRHRGSTHDAEEMALLARFRPRINNPADVRRAVRLQQG